MTFGSVFGRTFSPTFKPHSQAAAVAGDTWWNLNGAITSCVAAYQPKGAEDKATSFVNLVSTGTYDLSEAGTVPWSAANGLGVFSDNNYLVAAISENIKSVIFLLYLTTVSGERTLLSDQDSDNNKIAMLDTSTWYTTTTTSLARNFYFSPGKMFIDGSESVAIVTNDWHNLAAISSIDRNKTWRIGRSYNGSRFISGYVGAFAFYRDALTSTQIGNLTTAMAAL